MTVEEEARILALEDRRQYDPALVSWAAAHPNALHRQRIALALGRIGPHTFVDADNDNEMDANERRAGVTELVALSKDADRRIRETVAFSLGEIADAAATETLYAMTNDPDANVAAEAVEAISKLGGDAARYVTLTESAAEGVRARAVRFLFRFDTDVANEAALRALSSPSNAVRQEGAYAFSRKGYANARPQLELLLTDPNVLTRAYATSALGRIADAASVPLLVRTLGDVHPWVRANAALALSRTYEKHPTVPSSDHMPRLVAALTDPDPGVRAYSIDVLGFYAPANAEARQRLQSIVTNGTHQEREIATGAIARRLGQQYLEANPYETSSWGLVRLLEGTPSTRFYRDRFATNPTPLVRASAINAIPNESVDAELDTIRRALTDADVIVRTAAIDRYALATREDRATWLSTLEQIELRERTSEMNDARISAVRAIAEYDRPERATFLRSLLNDRDPVIRRIASDLIVEKLKANRPQYTPLPSTRTQAEYEEIVRWSRAPHTATIKMPRGNIELALLAAEAPITTWNFAQLARRKFFDNTSFMRVVPNFVIQGGDPRNDMNGGPGYAIRDEINLQKYTRGAVGMALSGPDTGGSQFFITHSPQPHLDGGYTIFGRVYEGMSGVVDQTERGDRVTTITIDEHPPVGAEQIGSISNVSLPLVVGAMTPESIYATLPSYVERRDQYAPDIAVIEMMKSYVRAEDRVEVYMGTWCDDSQREVPKFLRIADDLKKSYGVELPVKYIAMDRSKQEPKALLEGKQVQKVATFIYYRGDQELGRIVERPTGLFEDELLTIVAKER